MNLKSYFPTGILFHQVSNVIANKIESLVVSRLNKLKLEGDVFTDYFNKKIINISEIPMLIEEVDKCVQYYSNEINTKYKEISNYWVQDYGYNNIHELHNHGRVLFSLVYCVRANIDAGNLVIYDPSILRGVWGDSQHNSKYSLSKINIPPKKGQIVMFPGYLNHEVLPGGENCIRTTIAFNIN